MFSVVGSNRTFMELKRSQSTRVIASFSSSNRTFMELKPEQST